jgi:hypothetical protein
VGEGRRKEFVLLSERERERERKRERERVRKRGSCGKFVYERDSEDFEKIEFESLLSVYKRDADWGVFKTLFSE